jgi:hypothetical protein
MFRKLMLFAALVPLGVAGCSSSSVAPSTEGLTVVFSTNAGHTHLWQTQPTYTALITSNGNIVSDLDSLYLQYTPSTGTPAWTAFGPMFTQGTAGAWSASVYYPRQAVPGPDAVTGAEGTLLIRLMAHRKGQAGAATVLYAPGSTIGPVNQHTEGGTGALPGTTWRVEFAPVPGLTNTGTNAGVTFHVMQNTADANGFKAPVPGLTGLVVSCIDPTGASTTAPAVTETAPGTYSSTCPGAMGGWWHAKVTFTAVTGTPTFTGQYGVGAWYTAWTAP